MIINHKSIIINFHSIEPWITWILMIYSQWPTFQKANPPSPLLRLSSTHADDGTTWGPSLGCSGCAMKHRWCPQRFLNRHIMTDLIIFMTAPRFVDDFLWWISPNQDFHPKRRCVFALFTPARNSQMNNENQWTSLKFETSLVFCACLAGDGSNIRFYTCLSTNIQLDWIFWCIFKRFTRVMSHLTCSKTTY